MASNLGKLPNLSESSTLCNVSAVISAGILANRNRVVVPARQPTLAGEIDSLESIPGPLKSLKIPAQLLDVTRKGGA